MFADHRTYTTLISQMKGKGRLQQVVDWCGGPSFDGCIVFDECHKAKNFVPGKEAQSTKVSTYLPSNMHILCCALYCFSAVWMNSSHSCSSASSCTCVTQNSVNQGKDIKCVLHAEAAFLVAKRPWLT